MLSIIAIAFGAIFVGTDWIYNVIQPFIGPFANEALFGLWIMAGPLSIFLVRLKGSAVIGEVLAAFAEVLFGGTFGAAALISGLVQGFGSELGFLVYGYKKWNWTSLITSAVMVTVISFGYELFRLGYVHYSLSMMVALFMVRLLSDIIFGVTLVKVIYAMLLRANVMTAEVQK